MFIQFCEYTSRCILKIAPNNEAVAGGTVTSIHFVKIKTISFAKAIGLEPTPAGSPQIISPFDLPT